LDRKCVVALLVNPESWLVTEREVQAMPNVDRALWRQLYEDALAEKDRAASAAKIDVAMQAIELRLRVLPRGLADIEEMRDLSDARKKLLKRRKRDTPKDSLDAVATPIHYATAPLSWKAWLSIVLCGASAAVSSLLFRATSQRSALPFVCLAIVVFVGSRFGAKAGILGSLLAAVIFAVLLPPVGHFAIQSDAERSSVVWMVLAGVSLSYLVAKDPSDKSGTAPHSHS
jgi:K+-sensing histidine kinase KdpD